MLNIDELSNGIVIDHISAGMGRKIYDFLGLDQLENCSVALLQNVRSQKYGSKDMIKIEGNPELPFPVLRYLDPEITVIRIENGAVAEKFHPELPEKLVNVIRCTNPRCITSIETNCNHVFVLSPNGHYRCQYCEEEYNL